MEVFHWLANLPVRRYLRPPPGGYLVQWPPRHSCSQRSDDVDPVYWGLPYKLIWEDAERGKCVGPCSCTASVHSCQWRQAEWLDLHVSLNVVVLNSLYACFWVWCSGQTTVSYGKSFCGCFCLGSCPFLCVWFAVSFDETQVWLGDLRVVWLVCVMGGLLWFACISGPFRSLYKWRFYCLCSCKDRASVRHRPYSRKKKCCPSLPKHHVVWNCLGVVVAGFRSMAWVRCWFCGDIAGRMLFSAFALQWIVLSRLGVALLSFVLVFWCVVCFWTPPPFCPSRLLTHAKGHFVPWQGLGHRSGLKF